MIKTSFLRSRVVAACQLEGVVHNATEDSVIKMAESLKSESPSSWLEFCKKFRVQLVDGQFYDTSDTSDIVKLMGKVSDKYGPDSN